MPVLGIVMLVIQIGFAVHVVRTGRETFWLYIVLFIPGLGCLIYFLTQVLPDAGNSRTVRKAGNSLLKAVDPQRELRRRKDELAIADTIENRSKLAQECLEADLPQEAIPLLQGCLKGSYEHNPDLLLLLAQGYFDAKQFQSSKETLERLIEHNPSFSSHDGHLLYARTLEALELSDQALHEYEAVVQGYPGEEARVRYGLLLKHLGQMEKSRELMQEALLRARRAPKYYKKKEREWLKIAEQNT